jgi:hypothetical protein
MNHPSVSIDLSFEQLLDAVKKLQPTEKSLLNEALWDEDALIPTEHQSIVLDRIEKAKANPERLMDWKEASKLL